MQTLGSSGAANGSASTVSDVHSALRSNSALWMAVSLGLCCFGLFICIKRWEQLSVAALSWMGFSLLWMILMFRQAQIANGKLRMILALAQVEPMDKKQPLDKVLNVTTGTVNNMLYSGLLGFLFLWLAIATILSKHYPW
jgi:hypothetical protein